MLIIYTFKMREEERNEMLSSSHRRLYTEHSLSESQRSDDCDILQFRLEIHNKFLRSVANKIYSFPLLLGP